MLRRATGSTARLRSAGVAAVCVAIAATTIPSPVASAEPVAVTADGAHFAVLVPTGASLAAAETAIAANEGSVVQRWPQIGVVIARSPRADFAARVRTRPGVAAAGATRNLAELGGAAARVPNAPQFRKFDGPVIAGDRPAGTAATAEPLAANQWNMRLIGADRANELNPGSRDVLVGVLDSGVDATHPDLSANLDKAASVSCHQNGVPDRAEASWQDEHGHGTHVAGIVAAAKNGVGVAGVAPNVRFAAIKVGDASGYIYPESAICGYVWAAEHGVDVANASFSVDPWYLWCSDDPDQQAVAAAVQRSIDYAVSKAVTPVASLGNSNWDLAGEIVDSLSPTNGTPITRTTGDACRILPSEATGVTGVASVGAAKVRYYNSNYGQGVADLTGPGGDRLFQIPDTPDANGRVLSTVPGGYGYMQGTSMASPHVVGVLALLKSRYPSLSGQRLVVAAYRTATDMLPCPPGGVHDPDGTGQYRAVCVGGATGSGFYGAGLVNALKAVS